MKNKCSGCEIEKLRCYYLQKNGKNSGLDFIFGLDGKEHCVAFVFDKKGEKK